MTATTERPAAAKGEKRSYQVVRGCHVQDAPPGPDGKVPLAQNGRPQEVVYRQGDVVESEIDLVALHGEKFVRVGEDQYGLTQEVAEKLQRAEETLRDRDKVKSAYDKALERLDEKGLRELAKDVGADVKGLDFKAQRDEVVARVKAAAAG